jgi:hypothetical protein
MKRIQWSFHLVGFTVAVCILTFSSAVPARDTGKNSPSPEASLLSDIRQFIFQGRRSG